MPLAPLSLSPLAPLGGEGGGEGAFTGLDRRAPLTLTLSPLSGGEGNEEGDRGFKLADVARHHGKAVRRSHP